MQTKRNAGIEYVRCLLRRGRGTFSRQDAALELGGGSSLSNKLARLEASGWIMPVGRGFYAIIEPGNQTFGFAPPQTFLDDWAKHSAIQYYVGGVSAAEMHGAAHQRVQTYQVVTDRAIRPFEYGDLRVSFFRKQPITDRMWMNKSVPAGYLRVSTPEVTAYDLLFLPKACRSLSRVGTVLVELGEAMKAPALAELCKLECETIPLQRLGWLLDRTGWRKLTGKLHDALQQRKPQWRRLEPQLPEKATQRAMAHHREHGSGSGDLWRGLTAGKAQPDLIAQCFKRYMEESGLRVSGREYRLNMEQKMVHPDFIHDTDDLLRPGVSFDRKDAYAKLDRDVLSLL